MFRYALEVVSKPSVSSSGVAFIADTCRTYLFSSPPTAPLGHRPLAGPEIVEGCVRSADHAMSILLKSSNCCFEVIGKACQQRSSVVDAAWIKANDVEILSHMSSRHVERPAVATSCNDLNTFAVLSFASGPAESTVRT